MEKFHMMRVVQYTFLIHAITKRIISYDKSARADHFVDQFYCSDLCLWHLPFFDAASGYASSSFFELHRDWLDHWYRTNWLSCRCNRQCAVGAFYGSSSPHSFVGFSLLYLFELDAFSYQCVSNCTTASDDGLRCCNGMGADGFRSSIRNPFATSGQSVRSYFVRNSLWAVLKWAQYSKTSSIGWMEVHMDIFCRTYLHLVGLGFTAVTHRQGNVNSGRFQ